MPSDGEDETIIENVEAVEATENIEAAEKVAVAENIAADSTEVSTTDDSSPEKAQHSHISKKRRRKKKEKLDGPHAMYAKKLKVSEKAAFCRDAVPLPMR
jgi:hypothetical protein